MPWWIWNILGLLLLGLEFATPSAYVLTIIGISCITTGLLTLLEISGPEWFQWLLFFALSILLLRKVRVYLIGSDVSLNEVPLPQAPIGAEVISASDISPGSIGEGHMRGTIWTLRNIDTGSIVAGQKCIVAAVDGVELSVKALQ